MIRVRRTAEPGALTRNGERWKEEYRAAIEAYRRHPTAENKLQLSRSEKKYNHRDVRGALTGMFDGKCAYCESHVTHVSYPHIEHYRPKSRFPHLCFNWTNLLLGCAVCNGSEFKGDQFPGPAENGPIINPVTEHPEKFLRFDYDPATGVAAVLGTTPRGDKTVELLGLNERPTLVRHRSSVVRKMALIAIQASKGDAASLEEIKRCMGKEEEYAAFARMLFDKFGLS